MSIESLLENFSAPLEQRCLRKLWDQAEQADRQSKQVVTGFLDPREQQIALAIAKHFPGLRFYIYGGYPEAERARVSSWPASWGDASFPQVISCVQAEGNFNFVKLSHRDFLGAVLSLGVSRAMIGDIIYDEEENRAQILVDKLIAAYICANLYNVHNVKVHAEEVSLDSVKLRQARVKEIIGTVASLRLDAVASLGFGCSRSKISPLIKAEHIKINWQPVKSLTVKLKEGDIISLKGKGRIQLALLEGKSRKGRHRIKIKKYI